MFFESTVFGHDSTLALWEYKPVGELEASCPFFNIPNSCQGHFMIPHPQGRERKTWNT